MDDHLIRAVAADGNLRVVAALTTAMVKEGADRHRLSGVAGCALGRALTSGALLATMTKGNERVTIQLTGDGPLGAITVDANGAGEVRGYVRNPDVKLPSPVGRPQLGDALGRNGVVNVVRDLSTSLGQGTPLYQGQIAMTTGEVDEDIEGYLRISEQLPSALGCEVVLQGDEIVAAGGLLVQTLPGGDVSRIREVQHLLRTGQLYTLLSGPQQGATALAEAFSPLGRLEVVEEHRNLRFQCQCSAQRIDDMLRLLSAVDLDEMIAEGRPAEITCNFCNRKFLVESETLEKVRARIAGPRQSN